MEGAALPAVVLIMYTLLKQVSILLIYYIRYRYNHFYISHFGHSCSVLGLVAGSDLHSVFNLRLLPAITCQLTADSLW